MTQPTSMNALAFVRDVVAGSADDAAREGPFLALALLAVSVSSLLVDTLVQDSAAAFLNVLVGLLILYFQLLITFRMLHRHGAAPAGYEPRQMTRGRLPSVFVAGLLSELLMGVGFLLLVVPGLLLMVLCSLTNVAIAAESLRATDGMRRSWALVRPAIGRVALIGSLFVLAVVVIVLALVAAIEWLPEQRWIPIVLTDVAMPTVILGSAIVWVRVYLALRGASASTT